MMGRSQHRGEGRLAVETEAPAQGVCFFGDIFGPGLVVDGGEAP